jgi:hypothetical protein
MTTRRGRQATSLVSQSETASALKVSSAYHPVNRALTVSKRLQIARQFFKVAKKRKLISDNPFSEVSSTAVIQKGRQPG